MLSREDNRRLAQLERQLRIDDPEFCARMEGGRPPGPSWRRRFPISLVLTAVVIWTAAIVLGVVGWYISAAIAALWGTAVVAVLLIRARRRSRS